MLQNLFSVLTKEQIASLSQEERHFLTKIDEKLFPGYPEYVDAHMRAKSDVERCLERRNKQAEDDRQYQQMVEADFC